MLLARKLAAIAFLLGAMIPLSAAVCDGNPHEWGRLRRCDEFDPECPDLFKGCSVCEGVGGIAFDDKPESFTPVPCKPLSPSENPKAPKWPEVFVNDKFFEVQIFVKRDPFCLAQVPSSVSNGTHCYKPQEGTFNYRADAEPAALRIDYIQSVAPTFKHVNMTETFYHIGDCVHPDITRFGVHIPFGGICPCINVGIGIVAPNWAAGAQYVGREVLTVEYLWRDYTVDHWVKGPHHAWVDVESGNIVRMWQPFNGLEVFDPDHYNTTRPSDAGTGKPAYTLPETCKIGAKACINPNNKKAMNAFASEVARLAEQQSP